MVGPSLEDGSVAKALFNGQVVAESADTVVVEKALSRRQRGVSSNSWASSS